MNSFTPLTRPSQPQVTIDPTAKDCPSEGFTYPVFRQLNKQARVHLSQRFTPNPANYHRLFAVANSKGWFAAIQSTASGAAIILSPLEDLRAAFSDAKEDNDALFTPKRTLALPSSANIVVFGAGDTRLFVGFDNGSLAVYETSSLFTPGTNEVPPSKTTQIQDAALTQIVPNPGTEQTLSELTAVVGDGKVALLNMDLELQGGWAASDLMTQPISVAWSPKGKHVAIGLQTGDILTFALTNKSTPHKHIPPTADTVLVSLNWLGPGHTFRTSYAAQGDSPAKQHIITLDTKSSTATYFAPDHPFPAFDRTQQNAYVLNLARWDEDAGASSSDASQSLTIVGDFSSVDIEILGNKGTQWFRQSQDNPVSLPLDSNMDDTILLALEADLTDTSSGSPIIYAYLNDGTVQGWHAEHSKTYLGLVGVAASSIAQSSSTSTVQESRDTEMLTEAPPTPVVAEPPSAFGSTVQPTSAFGSQTNAFGQAAPAFGQASFGQPSAFGQTSRPSAFGSFAQATPPTNTNSTFGSVKPASGFGAFAGSGANAFGSTTGFGAFGSAAPAPAFGQAGFGSSPSPPISPPAFTREASMADDTAASVPSGGFGGMGLGSSTPADPSKTTNSMFGSFGPPSSTPASTTGAFGSTGGFVKPASGFGAFGAAQPTGNAFDLANKPSSGGSAFGQTTALSKPTTTPASGSGFGQTGFGQTSFGQPSFGQSSFGKTGFGSATSTPPSAGFGAFANKPSTFGAASTETEPKPAPSSGGFASFASTPATFGSAPTPAPSTESKSASGGFASFANAPSAFGTPSTDKPPSTTPAATPSSTSTGAFSTPSTQAAESTPTKTSVFGTPFGGSSTPAFGSTGFGSTQSATTPKETPTKPIALSPPSSPESTSSSPFGPPSGVFGGSSATPSAPPPVAGAFAGLQSTPSSSAFKPASGFGAFGSTTSNDSPFFKKTDQNPSTASAFSAIKPPTPSSASSVTSSPMFGSTSKLGAKPVAVTPSKADSTTPTTTPGATSSAFSAFAGTSGGFSAFAGQKKSFSDLLKESDKDVEKPTTDATAFSTPSKDGKGKEKATEAKEERTSVFGTPKAEGEGKVVSVTSAFKPIPKEADGSASKDSEQPSDKETKKIPPVPEEPSYGSISASSVASSFVDIGEEDKEEEEEEEAREDEGSDQDGEHHDDHSDFLSDDDELVERDDDEEDEEGSLPDEDEGSEDEDEEGEGEETISAPSPAAVPLPISRSPSATPQPEVPRIEVSPSPERRSPSPKPSLGREASITPPATPAAEAKQAFGNNGSSPALGVGRPSTRPTRSSPLANAVILGDDGDGETKKVTSLSLPDEEAAGERSPKRPKTPPLLTTMVPKSRGTSPAPEPAPVTEAKPVPAPDSKGKAAPPPQTTVSFSFGAGKPVTPPATPQFPGAFGTLPARPPAQPTPTAAQSSGFFGPKPPTPGGPFAKPSFNLTTPVAPSSTQQTPSVFAKPPLFGLQSQAAAPKPVTPFGQGFSFGAPKSEKEKPSATTTTSFFGSKPTPVTSVADVASTTAPGPIQGSASFSTKVQAPPQPPIKTQEEILEEGMQKECVNLLRTVESELEEIARTGSNARHNLETFDVSLGGSALRADLGNPAKWGMGDLEQFGKVLRQYEMDLEAMERDREKENQALKEIRSSMLKAGTRREEIARFNRAKDDKEFAKMLKSRTLGPEHSETQTQLRKNIRAIRDRVTKLEKRLQDDKKKLASAQSCKPRIKAPSLDTINRTYRNIEIAIEQQTDDLNGLTARFKVIARDAQALAAASSLTSSPLLQRDPRLPDLPAGSSYPPAPRKPINVTPNVAVTAAAALNAERNAFRLKNALLAVRKQPLLNDKATREPKAPVAFASASTSGGSQEMLKGFENLKGPLFSVDPGSALGLKDWDVGDDHFDPSGAAWTGNGNGRRGKKSHHTSTIAGTLGHGHASHGQPFRRSVGDDESISTAGGRAHGVAPSVSFTAQASTPKAPVSFDWGPLPNFATSSPPGPASAKLPIEPPKQVPRGFVSFSTVSTGSGSSTAVSTPQAPFGGGSTLGTPIAFARPPGSMPPPAPPSGFFGNFPSSSAMSAPPATKPMGFYPTPTSQAPSPAANAPSPASTATLSPLTTPANLPKGFISFANVGQK